MMVKKRRHGRALGWVKSQDLKVRDNSGGTLLKLGISARAKSLIIFISRVAMDGSCALRMIEGLTIKTMPW